MIFHISLNPNHTMTLWYSCNCMYQELNWYTYEDKEELLSLLDARLLLSFKPSFTQKSCRQPIPKLLTELNIEVSLPCSDTWRQTDSVLRPIPLHFQYEAFLSTWVHVLMYNTCILWIATKSLSFISSARPYWIGFLELAYLIYYHSAEETFT